MSLAVIVPTLGTRSTLMATLGSISHDVTADDQIIVVTEERIPEVHVLVDTFAMGQKGDWLYGFPEEKGEPSFGHSLRNYALDTAVTTSHVASIDDDDTYFPGALNLLRDACCDRPVIFKALWGDAHPAAGVTLWQDTRVVLGNVATPMVVAPVCDARFTLAPRSVPSPLEQRLNEEKGSAYCSDFRYVEELVAELGEPVWRDEVVALIRPVAP